MGRPRFTGSLGRLWAGLRIAWAGIACLRPPQPCVCCFENAEDASLISRPRSCWASARRGATACGAASSPPWPSGGTLRKCWPAPGRTARPSSELLGGCFAACLWAPPLVAGGAGLRLQVAGGVVVWRPSAGRCPERHVHLSPPCAPLPNRPPGASACSSRGGTTRRLRRRRGRGRAARPRGASWRSSRWTASCCARWWPQARFWAALEGALEGGVAWPALRCRGVPTAAAPPAAAPRAAARSRRAANSAALAAGRQYPQARRA